MKAQKNQETFNESLTKLDEQWNCGVIAIIYYDAKRQLKEYKERKTTFVMPNQKRRYFEGIDLVLRKDHISNEEDVKKNIMLKFEDSFRNYLDIPNSNSPQTFKNFDIYNYKFRETNDIIWNDLRTSFNKMWLDK